MHSPERGVDRSATAPHKTKQEIVLSQELQRHAQFIGERALVSRAEVGLKALAFPTATRIKETESACGLPMR